MIPEGTRIRIKDEAWARELPTTPYPKCPEQMVTAIDPQGRYMLSFPVYWWQEEDLEVIPPKNLYQFHWDCGRMGSILGIFAATEAEIKAALGKSLYFGEVLGKHSDIRGVLEEKDITLLTGDQEFIRKAIEYKLVPTGHSPLNYLAG